jgi:peptidyl-prolyl cis-trans isomerase C
MQSSAKISFFLAAFLAALLAVPGGWAAEPPASGSAAAANPIAELFGDPVVAKGKGVEIKRSKLDQAFTAYRANLAARGQAMPESQRTASEAKLLDRLIVTQLVIDRATDADKAKAKEVAAKFSEQSKKSASSEEAFVRQLKALGLTLEQYEERVQEQALAEVIIERELKSDIQVPEAQVTEFYQTGTDSLVRIVQGELERLAKAPDTPASQLAELKDQIDRLRQANLAKLEQPEKVRVSHVYFATRNRQTGEELPEDQKQAKRQLLERVLLKARLGENFAALVEKYSEDQALKDTHGEYTLTKDDPFTPEFKSAAFSLTNGQISEVVTTAYGHHLIKLLERMPAQKIGFEKVKGDIKDHLAQQALQQKMPAFFARLKREAAVEVLEPKYRLSTPVEPEPAKPEPAKPPGS